MRPATALRQGSRAAQGARTAHCSGQVGQLLAHPGKYIRCYGACVRLSPSVLICCVSLKWIVDACLLQTLGRLVICALWLCRAAGCVWCEAARAAGRCLQQGHGAVRHCDALWRGPCAGWKTCHRRCLPDEAHQASLASFVGPCATSSPPDGEVGAAAASLLCSACHRGHARG